MSQDGWACSYCGLVFVDAETATTHQRAQHADRIALAEAEKPPLGPMPHCAGCHKPMSQCDGLETCVGFYSPTLKS